MAEPAGAPEPERRRGAKSATAFRTISEVAADLDVLPHVLRFWESKFSQVRPLKRGGGRRYYRPEDIELLRSIRELLYTDGYTIKGVQKLLREGGLKSLSPTAEGQVAAEGAGAQRSVPRAKKPSKTAAPAEQPAEERGRVAAVESVEPPATIAAPAEIKALRGALEEVLGELEDAKLSLQKALA